MKNLFHKDNDCVTPATLKIDMIIMSQKYSGIVVFIYSLYFLQIYLAEVFSVIVPFLIYVDSAGQSRFLMLNMD